MINLVTDFLIRRQKYVLIDVGTILKGALILSFCPFVLL